MIREMRRKKQLLSHDECINVLLKGTSGVLAVLGDDDYPYAVPMSYVYDNEKIYFHCAKVGHKLDAIKNHSKVSFCVIDQDHIVPEEYTTYFRSVIVFGKARILTDRNEINQSIKILAKKYHPTDTKQHRDEMIDKEIQAMCMFVIEIDLMTGKQAIELVNQA